LINGLDELKKRLQLVIAIGSLPGDMQKPVDLRRGGPVF
jgi:hypothetical protein